MTLSNLKSTFIYFLLFAVQQVKSQEVVIKIDEDYTKPKGMMWVNGDEFQKRYIENGMYISKAGKSYPRLAFGYNINQLACKYSSDMEFTIVKLKGNKEDFITVMLFFMGLQFQYNELGDWQLGKDEYAVLKSGKAAVKEGTNVLKIIHRRDVFEFYLNGEKAVEQRYSEMKEIKWYDVKIFAKNKKFQIALDRAVFTGYLDEKNDKLGLFELERFSSISFLKVYGRSDMFIVNENGKQKLMDDRGRMSKVSFDKIDYTYSGNWLVVSNESKTQKGYIDSSGNEMLPMKYKEVATSLCNENNKDCFALGSYKIVDNTGEVFFINPKTKELINETEAKARQKVSQQ